MISYADFQKLEIKIGTILSVEKVEKSEKLLRFSFDIGEEKPRTILAGLAPYLSDLSSLVGKQLPILTNIEPRSMMGEESNGMILASDANESAVLLHPAAPVPPGSTVR